MQTEFTPFLSLGGGVLIGISAVLLMLTLGRVAGATGILGGILFPEGKGNWAWRVAVVSGMISAPIFTMLLTGTVPLVQIPISTAAIIIGGVIVGIGVTLGNGCTSGHGVCGMARLSPRSIIATLTFMAATGITVYIIRHVIGG